MPFHGSMKREIPFTMVIDNYNLAPAAITIVLINVRGGMNATLITLAAAVQGHQVNETLGQRVSRMLVYLNPPSGGSMGIQVNQGIYVSTIDHINGDGMVMFDVVP
jgi:hypothetical protein